MRPLAVVLVNSSFQPAVTVDDSAADDRAVPDSALRVERSGMGSGRIYTITYEARDDSWNVTVRQATVPSHAPRRAYADA